MHRSRFRTLAVLWTWLAFAGGALAQGLPRGDAKGLGLVPEKLDRIGQLLQEAVAARQIAGGSALVVRKGQVAYMTAVGAQDVEGNVPLRAETIFRIASMTKPITSVAAMMLVDEGKLRVSDPVSKYIPEFKNQTVLVVNTGDNKDAVPYTLVPAEREITVHHLLTHTSGISYGLFGRPHLGELYTKAGVSDGLVETPGTMADNCRRLAMAPLMHQPGVAWEYGLNTDVLGRVVEAASGQTLDEFFHQRIFTPLQMVDTDFIVPAEKRSRLAALYAPQEDKTIRRVPNEPQRIGPVVYSATYSTQDGSRYFSGGAGLCSTIGDYARFLQMLAGGGELDGVRLLKPETVAQMTSHQIGDMKLPQSNRGDGFGYGFAVITGREGPPPPASPAIGSYSWGGMFYTFFWVDPQRQVFGILMTQIYPSTHLTLREEFRQRTYEALAE
ncbi:MAG: serine hydrolase domain-containing protein [Planctomycetales bacterium]